MTWMGLAILVCEESAGGKGGVSRMDGVLAISVCEESEKDKLDVALKILRTLQSEKKGANGCCIFLWDRGRRLETITAI